MQFGLFGGARTKRGAGFEDSQGYESFIEYVIDAAREAHRKGKYAVFVTNGYGTVEAVRALKEAGFKFVSLDLEPFRSGRLNEAAGLVPLRQR